MAPNGKTSNTIQESLFSCICIRTSWEEQFFVYVTVFFVSRICISGLLMDSASYFTRAF
ncbi:hypothetical protein BVRB_5g114560 [Beta vulgaris subsp. vulgaris]|nr:hypothetical protein BVRB_5g114560 [Beta vulgaris subsp. vulgaris]